MFISFIITYISTIGYLGPINSFGISFLNKLGQRLTDICFRRLT